VIIGGGFAGPEMAKSLCTQSFQIVLLDKNKFAVLVNWVYLYFTYKQSLRLIMKHKPSPHQINENQHF